MDKKIVIITSNIAPYRLRWAEELAKFYEVEIVYTKDHDYERDDRWLQNSSNKCLVTKLNNPKDLYDPLCFDVIDILKKHKNSLIIFDGYGPKTNILGLRYCKKHHIKSFVNVDGYPKQTNILINAIKRFVIKYYCQYFFCSSELVRNHLIGYGAKKDKIFIHNFSSISEDEIIKKPLSDKEKQDVRKQLGIDTDKKIVLGVGRFLPLKRFSDLILAIKQCQSICELYILGGKPSEEYLDLAKDMDNVHFIDFVEPENVDKYYEAANLFVLASETEVWGLVINEAMAKGLPIIASDSVVGAYSLIKNNGLMFETYNVPKLSEAIDFCLDDNNLTRMSLESLKLIKDYTIEGMVIRQKPIIDSYFQNTL